MTRREGTQSTGDAGLSALDLARYHAAAAAADDPETLMGATEAAFEDLFALTSAGDLSSAAGAAIVVQDRCLAICASQSTSARAGDDKARFLGIIARWAFPRSPAVAAVLEAARQDEIRRWGRHRP